jgi:hypothetical protein
MRYFNANHTLLCLIFAYNTSISNRRHHLRQVRRYRIHQTQQLQHQNNRPLQTLSFQAQLRNRMLQLTLMQAIRHPAMH